MTLVIAQSRQVLQLQRIAGKLLHRETKTETSDAPLPLPDISLTAWQFKARCRKAKVRSVPVHTTRRTCASLLVAMDVHPRVVMQILRHSQIAVKMNIYSEVISSDTRDVLKRLGNELQGGDVA